MKRKSIIAVGMAALMSLALLAGCGSSTEPQSVSTNGSTSMEKVIGELFYIDFTICRSRI